MKSKELQKIILSKCYNGNTSKDTHYCVNCGISLRTIKRRCEMIRWSDSITLSTPSGCLRFVRTKGNIQKVKYRLCQKERVSARKLSMGLGISDRNIQRTMKNDLRLRPYTIVIELILSDDQKIKRKKFANWVRTKF